MAIEISGSTYDDANLMGYYRLESNGTDSSGNGNTLSGTAPSFVSAVFGNGGDFEAGSSQYLAVADASQTGLDITGDITISCWFKPESLSIAQMLVTKWDYGNNNRSYSLNFDSSNNLQLKYTPNGSTLTYFNLSSAEHGIATGNTYHILVTLDVSAYSAIYYVNGTKTTKSPVSGTGTSIFNGSAPFAIGCQHNNGNRESFLDGIIDDVAIWNRILSDSEASDIYSGSTTALKDIIYSGIIAFPR